MLVDPANAQTAKNWDGYIGSHWKEWDERQDESLARYQRPFFDATEIAPNASVLDIGCGNGQTTRDAARLATAGRAVGIDLSAQLIENARFLARKQGVSNASFLRGDAQIYPFETDSFDNAISRVGSMWFADAVAGFQNVSRALRPKGRLTLLTWQAQDENEWLSIFTTAFRVESTRPSPPHDAPGPLSFADPQRVQSVLEAAGFSDVKLEGLSEPMYFGKDADDAYRFLCSLAFSHWMLQDLEEDDRVRVLDALLASLREHETDEGVLYDSAVWIVTAQNG